MLVTCRKGNIGSAKTVQANGGVLENEVVSKIDHAEFGNIVQRYFINL